MYEGTTFSCLNSHIANATCLTKRKCLCQTLAMFSPKWFGTQSYAVKYQMTSCILELKRSYTKGRFFKSLYLWDLQLPRNYLHSGACHERRRQKIIIYMTTPNLYNGRHTKHYRHKKIKHPKIITKWGNPRKKGRAIKTGTWDNPRKPPTTKKRFGRHLRGGTPGRHKKRQRSPKPKGQKRKPRKNHTGGPPENKKRIHKKGALGPQKYWGKTLIGAPQQIYK